MVFGEVVGQFAAGFPFFEASAGTCFVIIEAVLEGRGGVADVGKFTFSACNAVNDIG